MKKHMCILGGMVLTAALLFAGCGSAGQETASSEMAMDAAAVTQDRSTTSLNGDYAGAEYGYSEYDSTEEAYPEEELDEAEAAAGDAGFTDTVSAGEEVQTESARKLIRNVRLDVETREFDSFLEKVTEKVTALGGYVEQSSVNGNSYAYSGNRYAYITARIPADRLEEFTQSVSEAGNVTNREESVEDITLSYVDTESRKKALETEQERLLALLEQAETVEDIITIESRLSEVRYELESYTSQLRTYDNLVDYSTVQLNIDEVERETPAQEQDTLSQIRTGLAENLYNVGQDLRNLCIGLIICLPYIICWAVALFLLYILVKIIYHKVLRRDGKPIFRRRRKADGKGNADSRKDADDEVHTESRE